MNDYYENTKKHQDQRLRTFLLLNPWSLDYYRKESMIILKPDNNNVLLYKSPANR